MNYRITKVSDQEPIKFNGQYGTTYYIKVMLDGHDKPVEIGKKNPNSLKVGDEVFGTIIPTQYQSDKFKAVKPLLKPVEDPAKQDSIIRQSSMKAAIDLVVNDKIGIDDLYTVADNIVGWVKGEYKPVAKLIKPDALKTEEVKEDVEPNFMDDDINLDDIPF